MNFAIIKKNQFCPHYAYRLLKTGNQEQRLKTAGKIEHLMQH